MTEVKQESFILSKVREVEKWIGFETEIKWMTTFIVLGYHTLAAYMIYYYTFPVKWQTVAFAYAMYIFSGFGITAGAHRYWSHRTFKASTPLRVIMMLGFAATGQDTLYKWVRNHRIHHKYSDTDADPHNRERGLFFAHIGWLLMKKNQKVISKFNETDMSDITNDPIINWHTKHVNIVNPLASLIIPSLVGILLWGEDWRVAVAWQCGIRLLFVFHSEMCVNSLAHTLGYKPYNKTMRPAENLLVATMTIGEGWHNYHHAFPFDYKSAEWCHFIDIATHLIHLSEKLGWVHDKREASKDAIRKYIAQQHEGDQTEKVEKEL